MDKTEGFKRILVGVDDSEDAQMGFRYAIREAKKIDATLIITSILEGNEMNVYQALDKDHVRSERTKLEENIKAYQQRAKEAGVEKVEVIVEEGIAGAVIVKKVIPASKADLLVIGSNSNKKKGLKRLLGSQAEYIAKNSPISVMIVR
ncbi:MAG TPA: universal stress protein [Lactovum miscens]|uniref:universal stress protein n=1 Tax=Lactovum miscens TaxID=190387 RepID=UPI002EDAD5D1